MNLDNILKLAQFVGPFVLAGFATIVLLKERSQRQETQTSKLERNVDEFVKEFRNCIGVLNATSERQAILQKVTNDTMLSMLSKLEQLEEKVHVNTTKIAILEEREK